MMDERASLSLRPSMTQWPEALAFIEAFCARHDVLREDMLRLSLVAEELFTNAVEHGCAGAVDGPIRFELAHEPGRLRLFIEDSAPAFDPLARVRDSAAIVDADIDGRPVGGLGLLLVEHFAAEVRYAREQGCNRLWITLETGTPAGDPGAQRPT